MNLLSDRVGPTGAVVGLDNEPRMLSALHLLAIYYSIAAHRLGMSPPAPPPPPDEPVLTERQIDVLGLMVQGKPNKLICRELGLAEGTVKTHVTAVLRVLAVTNRTQAVLAVSHLGLTFGK